MPQRLARLVVHAHDDIGVNHAGDGFQPGIGGKLLLHLRAIAENQEFDVGMVGVGERGARNDDRWPEIPAHGVKRDADLVRHAKPRTPLRKSGPAFALVVGPPTVEDE